MSYDITKLRKEVKKVLDKDRYQHTLGVMYTSASMAMSHGADIEKAMAAGVLHDCAKCYSTEEKYKLCKKYDMQLSKFEKENPSLLHARLGARMAEDVYGIHDQDIINAIRYHTTGRPNMSLLEKIVYISDYIEPWRPELPNMEDVRYLAFRDIDQCLSLMLGDSLKYLNSRNITIDPLTRETYEYYNKKK